MIPQTLQERCDAGILRALLVWCERGRDPEERTDVFVTTSASVEMLASAGLDVGYFDRNVASGSIRLADLETISAVDGVTWITPSARGRLHLDRSMAEIRATELRASSLPYEDGGVPGWTGERILVGIIDNTINEFHRSFRKPDTGLTRIVAIWNQIPHPDLVPKNMTKEQEENERARKGWWWPRKAPAHEDYGFDTTFKNGVLWDEAKINEALKRGDGHAIGLGAEEDHGSHVAGIAAGNGSIGDGPFPPYTFVGVAPEADIAFVNAGAFPSAILATQAMNFIFELARRRGQPCVINMSFGTHEGARDGSSALERAIDDALHDANGEPIPGRAVVVSAGNEGDARRHGRKPVGANETISFRLDVSTIVFPNKKTLETDNVNDKLYIWYDATASLKMRIKPPRGPVSDWLSPGHGDVVADGNKILASRWSVSVPNTFNNKLHMEIEFEAPMRTGEWRVEFQETAGGEAAVDLWVERNDKDLWPRLAFGDNVIENTVSCPATSASVIAVGNYNNDPEDAYGEQYGELVPSSSRGLDAAYGVPDEKVRPHLVAPGRRIISSAERKPDLTLEKSAIARRFRGVLLNRYTIMGGTSQAAPHVTGVVALMLEKNPTLTYRDIRQILTATASRKLIPDGLTLPNADWGYGKLDAAAAVGLTAPGP